MTDTVHTAAPLPRRWRVREIAGTRFLLHRAITGVFAVIGAFVLLFFALYASADPARAMLPQDATDADVAAVTAEYGFDRPIWVQFTNFVGSVLTGNLPDSFRYGENPFALALDHLGASVLLGTVALFIGAGLGGLVGYLAATGTGWWRRRGLPAVAIASHALPTFFLAVVLIYVFAVVLKVLPTNGLRTPAGLVLPVVVLAVSIIPDIARTVRVSVLELLDADHVRAARSRGLSGRRIALRHIVANAAAPVVNLLGVQAGYLLGGAVVVETTFGWPGLGQLAVNSLQNRDYPLVIACVLVLAVGFVIANLLADVLSALLEPRITA
ncbi:ABC transporter permease [Nocardia speluncae]|uniref:ABC transporter permease n=1 Tax=Nocardia speluncae TaxID=419477 RepID=A0A846XC53_9NOCA|nr:ABC transporter permease [Nocardia speluncae]NKY33512.1 ABC transporter permease [Nocardia speluncae]